MDLDAKVVVKKKRIFAPERQKDISKAVKRLKFINFIRRVQFPTWVSNVILVKNARNKWPICVDFTNLIQACLKNYFLILKID